MILYVSHEFTICILIINLFVAHQSISHVHVDISLHQLEILRGNVERNALQIHESTISGSARQNSAAGAVTIDKEGSYESRVLIDQFHLSCHDLPFPLRAVWRRLNDSLTSLGKTFYSAR